VAKLTYNQQKHQSDQAALLKIQNHDKGHEKSRKISNFRNSSPCFPERSQATIEDITGAAAEQYEHNTGFCVDDGGQE
jgi:hypothetical protein